MIKEELIKVQCIYFIFNLGRVLPHAILSIYMIKNGLSIGDIAVVQMCFMIAVITMEFPSGILSDKWSRKKVYVSGAIMVVISYVFIPQANNLILFSILWTIYGMGVAFISGTIENDILIKLKSTGKDDMIATFNRKIQQSFFSSALIGGMIGSIIYSIIDDKIYYLSCILMIISVLISITYTESEITEKRNNSINKKFFEDMVKDKNYLLSIMIILTLVIFTTIFYQYWQILFDSKNIDVIYFGLFYAIFQFSGIIAGKLYGHLHLKSKFLNVSYIVFICTGIISFVTTEFVFALSFTIFVASFYLINYYCWTIYKEDLKIKNISANTSFVGFLTSGVSLIILGVINILSKALDIQLIFLLISSLFLILNYVFINVKKKLNLNSNL